MFGLERYFTVPHPMQTFTPISCSVVNRKQQRVVGLLAPSQRYSTIEDEEAWQL